MKISERLLNYSKITIPWYCGVTWKSDYDNYIYYHIIPFNYILRYSIKITASLTRILWKISTC